MFKIGEFSKLTQVSIRMLRYYDEVGIFKPNKIDKYTGYRLYSVEQIPLLQKIILLRDLKFNVIEISNIINNWDNSFIKQQLEYKKYKLYEEIQHQFQIIDIIDNIIGDIQIDTNSPYYNFNIKQIPSYKILSLEKNVDSYSDEGILWAELLEFVQDNHIEVSNQSEHNIAIYNNKKNNTSSVNIEIGIVVKNLKNDLSKFKYHTTEPVNTMACTMVYGSYNNIAPAYQEFCNFLKHNTQYKLSNTSRQICHKGPHNEENPDKYLTEIQIPIV